MRVNMAGYAGPAMSVMCAINNTGLLGVLRVVPLETKDRPGFLRIASHTSEEAADAVFNQDDAREAIGAFFTLKSLGLVQIDAKANSADPANKIEQDGIDASGQKYRIAPDISNQQMGVLAACWFAERQRGAARAIEAAEELSELMLQFHTIR